MASHRETLSAGAAQLAAAGIENAALDARLLLQHAGSIDHAGLISRLPQAFDGDTSRRYRGMIERRLAGEPVSRIVGRRAFHGLELAVTPDVLDPRPETEALVERVLADHAGGAPYFCDIGTGSGAIAIALAAAMPLARCVAVDICARALDVARANAAACGVADRMEFVRADMLSGISGPFDFIVSNPPYVESGAIAGLAREVALHDPHVALDGGPDGLAAYRAILGQARAALKSGGRIYLEFGAGQEPALAGLAQALGWQVIDVVADLAGIARAMVAAAR